MKKASLLLQTLPPLKRLFLKRIRARERALVGALWFRGGASSSKVVEAMEQRHRTPYAMPQMPAVPCAAASSTLTKQVPKLFTAFGAENTNPGVLQENRYE